MNFYDYLEHRKNVRTFKSLGGFMLSAVMLHKYAEQLNLEEMFEPTDPVYIHFKTLADKIAEVQPFIENTPEFEDFDEFSYELMDRISDRNNRRNKFIKVRHINIGENYPLVTEKEVQDFINKKKGNNYLYVGLASNTPSKYMNIVADYILDTNEKLFNTPLSNSVISHNSIIEIYR